MKKTLSFLTVLALMPIGAFAQPLYSQTNEQLVTGGVSHITKEEFYGDYALSINCITADLTNENISFELLKHSGGSDKLSTVMNMAKENEDTVAAINGDFFAVYKGDQNFSLGLEVKDGKLLQSHINSDMAAGFFKENALSLSYLDFKVTLTAPDGEKAPIAHINKPTDYYGAVLMYTSDFNGGTSPFLPEGVTAVTVTDGIVTAKGTSLGGSIPVPEDGYILVINDNMTPFLDTRFNVGDKAEISVEVTPSLENVTEAFGGGTLLLKDGEKTPITHNVSGNNPRSVIGTNEDGTVIYMITVDGRQSISRGVSLEKLADICLELGCINAINLDGGGSTAMVGKTYENGELHYINSPSEERKVINALAITSTSQKGEAVGLFARPEQEYVLNGDSVRLNFSAYDENYNVPESTNKSVRWSVPKGRGSIINNVYYPKGSGEVVLDLYYGGKKTDSCSITVLDNVSGIIAKEGYSLSLGETASLNGTIKVFDSYGNTAVINDIAVLNPTYDKSFISLKDGVVKPLRDGGGQIKLSYGGAQRSIKVTCGLFEADTDKPIVVDSMNRESGGGFTFDVYSGSDITTLYDRIVYAHAMDILENSDAAAMVGGEMPQDLTPENLELIVPDGWSEKNYGNSKIVTLSLNKKGVMTRGEQWKNLYTALNDSNSKNIFILADKPVDFVTDIDKRAFHSMLQEAAKTKNVFVILSGDENFCRIANGVRFITLSDPRDEDMLHLSIENTKYLSFNITESEVTYQFKNLYNQE
ncbi:MAG: phosphodiester glycosidase family protein [Clostridia bacterium]|nr:phosphodiester glycosidase family protein [Clostridia bacterium]